ncbi:sulfatase [uncultured Draconibacterium sp.]|uniref:sulfatase family protein n=1 Tax=uncultured Draconibacterium sp. TaxID=1573823 RepID=UPI0025FAF205|nr:sulfatase [uncultured Draconibacterium sp.]
MRSIKNIVLQVFFFAILLIVFTSVQAAKNKNKPNILWITIEDTSPQFIGCYGNTDARTPVIDKLAEEGVRFTNAFSTGTVCSPSRTAIITGVKTYHTGTGNHRSKYPVPDFMKGYPYYLQKQGYYTTNNAKTDYNVKNEQEYIKEAWNESSNNAGWWNRKKGQPFFAVFNYADCHQSRTMSMSYDYYLKNVWDKLKSADRIREDEFEMPPIYRDSKAMRKQFARVYNSIKLTDNRIGELLERLDKDGLTDSTIIFFYADHGEGMPRGKTNGINYGYRVPFVIWFPEMYKHLSPWGTGGVVSDELIDFSDLAPTLLSLVGEKIPDYMDGRPYLGNKRKKAVDHLVLSSDRSDNGIDMIRTVTDGRFVYSRNFMPFIPELRYIRYMEIGAIKQQMRTDLAEGKLNDLQSSLFAPRQAEVLYDIDNDLWETKNLVNDEAYAGQLEKMRSLLEDEMLKTKDVMLLPEYEIAALSETTTAFEFRQNSKDFPVNEIYNAAALCGFRGEEWAAKQVALLNHKNKIVRYWAALGLRSQPKEVLDSFKTNIMASMADNYPPVALTASAICWEEFAAAEAKDKLQEFCLSNNMQLALMAVNNLLYVKDKAPFVETIQEVRRLEKRDYNVKASCMDFLGSLGLIPNNPDYRE